MPTRRWPQQAVEPLLPGASSLRGPTGCIADPHPGADGSPASRIARVSFYLDGRYVGTRTKPNSGHAYTLTVRGPRSYAAARTGRRA